MTPKAREERLIEYVSRFADVIVAFSGGVDSSYLAFICHQVLGPRSLAVTGLSPSVSAEQRRHAENFAREHELRHRTLDTFEVDDPHYRANPSNRCYFCKTELYGHLGRLRERLGAEALLDGANVDDVGDHRPGEKAAREAGVLSPLRQVGFTKADIRARSRHWGLASWDRPAMPCLASRFPYGTSIDAAKLGQVEAAEAFLRSLGLVEFRVRHHEGLARIEVHPEEMSRLLSTDILSRIHAELRGLGYLYVTLDLGGFRSGSLNEALGKPGRGSGPSRERDLEIQ